jgi:aspartyl-tRNA(Asn)/glutamyl-tRNA(Gln) amidotransferase subunit C
MVRRRFTPGVFWYKVEDMISRETIEKLAELSRIHLTKDEEQKFQEDIGRILDYVKKLEEVETGAMAPLASITGAKNIMRDDAAELHVPGSNPKDLLNAAPVSEDGYVKTRSVWN